MGSCQRIQFFSRFLTEDGGSQLVNDQLFQAIITGVTQNQNGVSTAGFPQQDTLFPNGYRKAVYSCIAQGGINLLNAVTIAVTFQNCHHLTAGMEPCLDIADIMTQSLKPDNCFCPLSQLSQRYIPLSVIQTPNIIAYR